jgi:hypothetical protein
MTGNPEVTVANGRSSNPDLPWCRNHVILNRVENR